MSNEVKIKKKMVRAKVAATNLLVRSGYQVVPSTNDNFCIVGIRQNEMRMIRVALDRITEQDVGLINAFRVPSNCTKEIWCKHGQQFEIKEF